MNARDTLGDAVSPQLLMDLAQSCIAHELPGSAIALLEQLEAQGVALCGGLEAVLVRHRRKAEFEPLEPLPADMASEPAAVPAGAVAQQGTQEVVAQPAQEVVAQPAAADPDRFDVTALPPAVRPLAAASNAADSDFDQASAAAAALLQLFKDGQAGSANDLVCMRVLLRRMFLGKSRHPSTVLFHKEFAQVQQRLAASS